MESLNDEAKRIRRRGASMCGVARLHIHVYTGQRGTYLEPGAGLVTHGVPPSYDYQHKICEAEHNRMAIAAKALE